MTSRYDPRRRPSDDYRDYRSYDNEFVRHRSPYHSSPADPWERAFDGAEPESPEAHPQRRWEDKLPERRRRPRPFMMRGRDFVRRFRQPLIGLTLAGAAAPMARAMRGNGHDVSPRAVEQQHSKLRGSIYKSRASTAPAQSQVAGGRDLEEEAGAHLAVNRDAQARDTTVKAAVENYEIDQNLAETIYDIAQEAGIKPEMAYGLVNVESRFKTRAVSHVGARGLSQVMPRTARWLKPGTTAEDLFNPTTNLRLGFNYLKDLIDKYDGNTHLALTAYNRGPGTVDRVLKRGGDPDNGYAGKVLSSSLRG